jgi:hypothetical protein
LKDCEADLIPEQAGYRRKDELRADFPASDNSPVALSLPMNRAEWPISSTAQRDRRFLAKDALDN